MKTIQIKKMRIHLKTQGWGNTTKAAYRRFIALLIIVGKKYRKSTSRVLKNYKKVTGSTQRKWKEEQKLMKRKQKY